MKRTKAANSKQIEVELDKARRRVAQAEAALYQVKVKQAYLLGSWPKHPR
jgi:hypothetical protein